MKMTKLEKRFVNRKNKAERNIEKIEHAFEHIDVDRINTVLELGCGIGFVSTYLADTYGFEVYGTDYDTGQIEIARKLQPQLKQLHFQVEDASNLSFEDSSFDLVLSQNVFHHVPNWEGAIGEIARVLKSGGYFIWLDLTFSKGLKTIFHPIVKNYGLYTVRDVEAAFQKNGFCELLHERFSHGIFSQHHFVLQRN